MNENLCIRLARRPRGVPVVEDFEPGVADELASGIKCRSLFISLDPYLRGRLSGRHLSGVIAPGEPMSSEMVLAVTESAHGFKAGELVRAHGPWQERLTLPPEALHRVSADIQPASLALGVLGMPGLTAYAGVHRVLMPARGETLLVSAAAGPVGATVAQLARIAGACVIGMAGSDEKCDWLREQAGITEVIHYKRADLRESLKTMCPQRLDMYFDNVGGDVLQAAMERLAIGARVALCGLVSQYHEEQAPAGPNPALIILARARVQGLVVYDHEDLRTEMEVRLAQHIAEGRLAYREDISDGLASAPEAFCRLMRGENFGKSLVRV